MESFVNTAAITSNLPGPFIWQGKNSEWNDNISPCQLLRTSGRTVLWQTQFFYRLN
jgi:hypothetical protein